MISLRLQSPARLGVLAAAVLWLWIAAVDFTLPFFRTWQDDSDSLVTTSVERSLRDGIGFLDGFMFSDDPTVHRRAVIAIDPRRASEAHLPYIAQYGLQYKVLAALAPSDPARLPAYFALARLLGMLALAAALAALVARILADAGPAAGVATLVGLMLSPYLVAVGRSLYWAPVLMFLPFVVSFVAWERCRTPAARAAFFAAIAALVFLKSLCGYEFVTNVAGSAAAGVFYAAFKQRRPLRTTLAPVSLAALASVAGFALAALMHVRQARHYFGDSQLATRVLTLPAHYVTTGAAGIRDAPLGVQDVVRLVLVYLNRPTFVFLSLQAVMALLAVATALAVGMRRARLDAFVPEQRRRAIDALVRTAWLGLPISSLWWLAFEHMVNHGHINTIMFYLPLLPLAFAAIGAVGGVAAEALARARAGT